MALYLGLLIFSFIVTSILLVPFIDLLYRLRFTHHHNIPATFKEETAAFSAINKSQTNKIGTPVGGGILLITVVSVLFTIAYSLFFKLGITVSSLFASPKELNILFFTFISFGLIGLYDDLLKIFKIPQHLESPVNSTRKSVLILILSSLVSLMLYLNLHIEIIHLPFITTLNLGWIYIPFATIIISFFTRAFDITDGLDGLAGGMLLIALLAFWGISFTVLDSILSIFIALWVGGLLSFLYFNVFPARIWLGNAGSLSFGSTIAVIGLLLGKTTALFFVGSIFIIEALTQLIQVVSLRLFNRQVFTVTPLHYFLQSKGWPEPKIVMRFWLITFMTSMIGLWLIGI